MSITASQREALNAMCPAAGVAALGDVIHRMTNVVTVSGNGWLVDFYALTNGERVEIVVDHSSSADFLLVEAPVFKQDSGYTEEEIRRKRMALRGVLVPLTAEFNNDLLRRVGFREIDCVWRWFNFAGWVAIK